MGLVAGAIAAIADFAVDAFAGAGALEALGGTALIGEGASAVTLGGLASGVAGGALVGGAEGALTGQGFLKGAEGGAITGGVGSFGPALGAATGLGTTAGDVLAGTAGGALGGLATGGNALTGAALGGAGGLAAGLTSGTSLLGNNAGSAAPAAGPSASSLSAPSSVAATTPTDLTSVSGASDFSGSGVAPSSSDSGWSSGSNAPSAVSTANSLGVGGGGPSGGSFTPSLVDANANLAGSLPASSAASQLGVAPSTGTGSAAPTDAIDPWGGTGTTDNSGFGSAAKSSGTFGKVGDFLSNNSKLLGVGVSGVGLLNNLMSKSNVPGVNQISQQAAAAQQQGQVLQNYLATGTLPPAVQASVNAVTADGITAIKNKYAGMGISGSTGEVQDIARLQQQAVIQGATLADQMLQQGISESQLSGQLYNELVQYNVNQNKATGEAIGNMASALAGGGRSGSINIPISSLFSSGSSS